MLSVRGEQQVMLKVKIVEASRSAVKNLGLNLQSLGGASIGDVTGDFASSVGLGLSEPQQFAAAALNYSSGTFGDLNFLAQALEQEGIVNTLAEPNLTAISGEQAGFLAGGEIPIPTERDDEGNLVYVFKPFGVSLNFTPHVMSKDRISLQLTTEVSTTSFDQGLQLNGINIPTFNVRRAETNVELPSGGTLMIAGLIESDSISTLTQLPGVGDVPVVGDLIKSDAFQRSESEVLIMVTPYLVQPFAQNQTATAALSASPKTAMTMHPAPETSYGAILPEDINAPVLFEGEVVTSNILPERKPEDLAIPKIYKSDFFTDNIRRVYGQDTPETLLSETNSFGYMLD
jgi:pilus assembly protein CpaC